MSITKLATLVFLLFIGMFLLGFYPEVTRVVAAVAALVAFVATLLEK